VVKLLLARQGVEVNKALQKGGTALYLASYYGHVEVVRLLLAHRSHEQVRLLVADAIDSLPASLILDMPDLAAQAAALRLPLDVALALGDTEEERAAADVLASQSALFDVANADLAASAPKEFVRAARMMRTCASAAMSVAWLASLIARNMSAPKAAVCTVASSWCRSIARMMRTCASAAMSVSLLALLAARFMSAMQPQSCTCASSWCRSIAWMMRT
jgi:ankyrin repeat protein